MRRLLVLMLTGLAVTALAARPIAQGVNVSGEWAMTVNTDNGPIAATLVFTQDGDKITGSVKGEQGELTLEGSVKEKTVSFSFLYPTPDGNALSVTMTGAVEGDTIKGTYDAGGVASGDWTATKSK